MKGRGEIAQFLLHTGIPGETFFINSLNSLTNFLAKIFLYVDINSVKEKTVTPTEKRHIFAFIILSIDNRHCKTLSGVELQEH